MQKELRAIYKSYGFQERETGNDDILAFTLKNGYYDNADIVVLKLGTNSDKVFETFKKSGFACKVRYYENIKELKRELFKGFFSVDSTKKRFQKEYQSFVSNIERSISEDATYSYIETKYHVDNVEQDSNIIKFVCSELNKEGPALFLIEAAAGFGKTCTAYELLADIVSNPSNKIPLFCELSRNRQAKIFRYVLLDEIDRTFPSLSSRLVMSEIQNGNIVVILDGFDELLHQSDDNEGYENTEPMLETIGELLQNNAKVILTTRRTVIFEGDDFSEWVESHNGEFGLYRIRLDKPFVSDWLTTSRLEQLQEAKFNISELSNPVLLSYLRSISDTHFSTLVASKNLIIERYFEAMLEREMQRQDLKLNPDQQLSILKSISADMMDLDYTSEAREYILDLILTNHKKTLENAREQYPRSEKPSLDELANKLASHALLDRSDSDEDSIGFVNEFVLGTLCGEIVAETEDWIGDERFIEPMVMAFIPRSNTLKDKLYKSLLFQLAFIDSSVRAILTVKLTGKLDFHSEAETFSDLELSHIRVADSEVLLDGLFIDCTFSHVNFNLANLNNVTFSNCRFFDCSVSNQNQKLKPYSIGCTFDNEDFEKALSADEAEQGNENVDESLLCQQYIMEQFYPVGRSTAHKHRSIKSICATPRFQNQQVMREINNLKKEDILLTPDKQSFVELNFNEMTKIRKILGR